MVLPIEDEGDVEKFFGLMVELTADNDKGCAVMADRNRALILF